MSLVSFVIGFFVGGFLSQFIDIPALFYKAVDYVKGLFSSPDKVETPVVDTPTTPAVDETKPADTAAK